jgi:HD-GYP domain-containing protein (c-di-GMP phosphodiesterase class II)
MTVGKSDVLIRKLMFNISTLEDLGNVISSSEVFEERVGTALISIMGALPVAKGGILLYSGGEDGHRLTLVASRGVEVKPGLSIPFPPVLRDAFVVDQEAVFRRYPPLFIKEYMEDHRLIFNALNADVFQPLVFKTDFMGLVSLGPKFNLEPFSEADLELLRIMANYTSIGMHNQDLMNSLEESNMALRKKIIENSRLYADLQEIYVDTVRALGTAIDAKDPYTRGHSDRVARFSVAIARRMGLDKEEICALNLASHLHDIGKIAIDNSILCKPDKLDSSEFDLICRHPQVSFDILSNIKFPYREVALLTKHHHERVNGSGYPDGKSGSELSRGMKILALADAFDAMTSDRPYRPALSVEKALEEIGQCVSDQFDPEVVRTFLHALKEEAQEEPDSGGIITSTGKTCDLGHLGSVIDHILRGFPGISSHRQDH